MADEFRRFLSEIPLRPAGVAEALGVSYAEARKRMEDGRIEAFRDGRILWTYPSLLEAYLERCRVSSTLPCSEVSQRKKHPAPMGKALDFVRRFDEG